ncbi:MAG: hypothetical protein COW00_20125 [Bdellovibrio sp. CG12_big_fil_rev_8_21_14_0_65_39_13]|nr:MAG: hypothetical protein COW78_01780 [Bdellovibrio sp. CG22_combo_CG10-13_8_21_14_all_39_27]PIQ57537.1 MAG: hypothetical protein COW00_20125 [Bdellovibrio sp. CG12_big_fil_rev_8_21_14_0_65_39_13]PIR33740.1 MAG: hypothetical protein COV37_15215 [Bdellovibrio sp. CG11_big_fil_rev_8_21_14_0_20_39_38]
MKPIIYCLILSFLNSCHATLINNISEKESQLLLKKNLCDIQISFGSYGSGVPTNVQSKIVELLKGREGVKRISNWTWGLEGESDYCVEFNEEKSAYDTKDEIIKLIPATSKNGYTILKFQGKEMMRTRWPKS